MSALSLTKQQDNPLMTRAVLSVLSQPWLRPSAKRPPSLHSPNRLNYARFLDASDVCYRNRVRDCLMGFFCRHIKPFGMHSQPHSPVQQRLWQQSTPTVTLTLKIAGAPNPLVLLGRLSDDFGFSNLKSQLGQTVALIFAELVNEAGNAFQLVDVISFSGR